MPGFGLKRTNQEALAKRLGSPQTAIMFIPVIIFLASATFSDPAMVVVQDMSQGEPIQKTETVGEYVDDYFADTPILADIAWCESSDRHFDKDGTILRGKVDRDDIGVMQINTRYHGEKAEELGIDLYTIDGNLAYAKYLYEKQGTKPWRSSEPCWGKVAVK